MKKIEYIAFVASGQLGVRNKIEVQVQAWEKNGATVDVFYDFDKYGTLIKLFYRYWVFLKLFVFQRHSSSYIYLRQTVSLPLLPFFSSFKSFSYEVNADIQQERKTYSLLKQLVFLTLKDRFALKADKIFFVSDEIRKRHPTACADAYVFPNSLPGLPIERSLPRGNNIVFVGSEEHHWQGVDLLKRLITLMPDCNFHLVGNISGLKSDNVTYHGVLSGENYYELMERMDYAIGTLAFYRSGLSEGSPLKVRDYLKYNLPVIVGYKDSDFNDTSFMLKISTDNLEMGLNEIKHFLSDWQNKSIEIPPDCVALFERRESERVRLITS